MLTAFRRATKSTLGLIVIIFVGLMIMIGFAMGDLTNLGVGGPNLGSNTLASAGSLEVTDSEMSAAMQRRLAQAREQDPEATYSSIAQDFEPILQQLIDQKALQAFADKHGFVISKRLVDAEIASLPGVRGLTGEVTSQSYQQFLAQQRVTDAEVRDAITAALLQRLLLTPAASNARVPIGIATPYASMLLEERQGQVALLPLEPFTAGLNPTDAQIQQFYGANRSRYMVPEQRVLKLARIGPEQVANVTATEEEIQAQYKANQDEYGAKEFRVIKQAVVPSEQVAKQIAQRARAGQSFEQAAKPAGLGPQDVSVGEQSRQQFADLAGETVASAAFAAQAGEIAGPIQSDLGWHVVKIESARTEGGRSLAQVRDEIAERIAAEKRAAALADIVNKVQDAIDEGANFNEAAQAASLPVTTTPMITAAGVARGNASYTFPEELQPALRSGFELSPGDQPVVDQLRGEQGFVLVGPAQVEPAAPAPPASIRDKLRADWIRQEAIRRAREAANAIAAQAKGETSLSEAVDGLDTPLPPVRSVSMRRIQLTEMGNNVPPYFRAIFTTLEGATRAGSDPEGRGFFVVKVNKIIPGNALNQPRLIAQVQAQFGEPLAQEYAQQLMSAVRKRVGVERNEAAIAEARKRMTSPAF
ncbi:MAG TPA: peptidyl-prolyl cis-trans isomerase [Sphingomicrobium sp.]|nr:peptidyl-prolyl cis-trans isomerase [Sphingomicrobium sp.]